MAAFSTNQNRHLYVATSYNATPATAGAIGVGTVGVGTNQQLFFNYVNKKGEIIKSDYIPLKNLDYIKAVKASEMVLPLKKVEVTLDTNVNGGAPLAGQDYVLRINFDQWIGASDIYTYTKDAAVHATSAMDNAKKFFDAMKASLDLAFSREVGATKTSNPYLDFTVSGSGSSAKLVITEKPQDYSIGTETQEKVLFDVQPTTVYTGGDDVIWGVVTPVASTKTVGTDAIGNGPRIADLEYFCLGERGDQYRNIGWPNVVITEGMADPALQYNVLELHFAFTDEGVNSYRSEKDITIAMPLSDTSGGGGATIYDDINDLIDAINTAAGTTLVAELADI